MERWRSIELAELKRLAEQGASAPEIASRLGRTTGAVQQKALELGVVLVRVDRTGWRQGQPASLAHEEAARPG